MSFRCRICRIRIGENKNAVALHWKQLHPDLPIAEVCPGTKLIECVHCNWIGTTSRGYSCHLQHEHPEQAFETFKKFAPLARMCGCGKMFSGHSGLLLHRGTCARGHIEPHGRNERKSVSRLFGGKACSLSKAVSLQQ